MIKIVKTIAVAVAVTCMFAMASGEASAQCLRGGGFNSGFGNVGGIYSSGFRGNVGGFGTSGFNRGLSININSRPSVYKGKSIYRSSGRNFVKGGKFGY